MNSLLRILVIEDNPGDVSILEDMLSEAGLLFELIFTERLSSALRLIKTDYFDAILLDLGLPDSYGLDTLMKLIAVKPTAPVIVLTGLADEVVGRDAVKAGAQDYLVKGNFDMHLLSRSIRYAIERKRSADLIKTAANEWSMTFDAMVDGVSIFDVDYTLLNANKSLIELFGTSKDALIGKKCHEIFHQHECSPAVCPLSKTKETGQRSHYELYEPEINKWLAVSTSPVFDDSGALLRIVHSVRDITEHRKLELQLRQSQKMESIGNLAGGIAHDFNNILTIINGYGTLALMKIAKDDPLVLYMQNILEASERAAALTRDLLVFSRKESVERIPMNLNDLLERNGRFLKRVISEDIDYKTDLHKDPLMLMANEHQLEQVLMSLATNANDAMPQGGTLVVKSAPFSMDSRFVIENGYGQAGRYALLTFEDTGTGMDGETQKHIFDPFFTTKGVGKGTGLGLAVVYGIIKQHDGYITVYSEPGVGTRFTIYLPLLAEKSPYGSSSQLEEAVPGGTETILLAEDDELVRRLAQRVLTENGYTVIEAVDGLDAVSRFSENSTTVDLLLFDLIMPKMNGKEACDRIRKLRPSIKAIFASGYAPEIIRQKVLLLEDVHLLAKPLLTKELLRKVRSVLDGEQ